MIFRVLDELQGRPANIIFAALIGVLGAVILSLSVHEWGHAFAAYKSGDPTAKNMGRMTLNPARHIDPMGFLCLALAGFGWAKPVPVNSNNFTHPRKGMYWVSVAGVITNYIMAFITYALFLAVLVHWAPPEGWLTHLWYLLFFFFQYMFLINISLFLFNLLPIYPLDGFKILEIATKPNNAYVRFMYKYGSFVLLGILLFSVYLFDIFGLYIDNVGTWISWPITALWGLLL